jgi:hypothetical protein
MEIKKPFRVSCSLKGLVGFAARYLVLLGSCLLSRGYLHNHGDHGGSGGQAQAQNLHRHGVTHKLLMSVVPDSSHWKFRTK